jgi:type VI protein secretion system component Hcp
LSATGDSITYTIFGWGSPGTIINYSQGSSHPGGTGFAQVQDFGFIKFNDINSTEFRKRLFSAQVTANIEFKCYLPGTTTLYFSIKLYSFRVSSYRVAGSVSDKLIEEYSLTFTKIGFKDWINGTSFGYDLNTKLVESY